MFEPHVLHLLRKYLGEYIHGLSNEALRISVWKGNVILKDLKLKAEALNSLKLPIIVKAGFVGTITLKVPWKSLGKEPVIVLIDRVFILAHPSLDVNHRKEEDMDKFFKAKLQQIEEMELTTLEAATKASKNGSPSTGSSWLSSLVSTIIGNLKITISNVHIRYEDSISNPGHPFCCGITLAKLAAFTMDETGKETFDTSGALDKLRKSLHLQRLAVYHDSNRNPWKFDKKWEDLSPIEWTEIFADGIDVINGDQATLWAMDRKYIVSPINGILKYYRLGKLERLNPEIPFEKVSVVLSDVSLTILEAQYYDGIKLLETISRFKTSVEVSHLRPVHSVSKNPAIWWRYSVQASLQQKKMCIKFSWERIKHLCQLRRRYVQLYVSSLRFIKNDDFEIRQIESDLDSKVIVLWRLLAHAKIESEKSKEVCQQISPKKSWWSFGWSDASVDTSISDNAAQSSFHEEKFTKEEWKAINKMLSYEIDEVTTIGKEMHAMILFLIDVSIDQAAARIISIDQTEILCGRFEHLNVTTKLYHKSVQCDVLLRFCGLSAPEGTLAQSVSSEKKVNALAASFVHLPVGENVDWRLSAAIAPCHVTVFMESYNRFLDFMKRSKAVSPTVALETTTALQLKIEKVTRRAHEQFQMVLEEQSRFSLDIDLDAPKLRVPLGDCLHSSSDGNFLLDFGNFKVQTRDVEHDEQRRSIYSRFHISVKDIAAFFKDGCPDNGKCSAMQIFDNQTFSFFTLNERNFYSLIDRCRMSIIIDQIKVPHPMYPSTRISIEVPNLGIHFSPARYCRISDLLGVLNGSRCSELDIDGDNQTSLLPQYPADLTSDVRVLVWRGFGNSLAEWQPCFLILSGLYLYVLESEVAQSYQRRCSMFGRHVFEVSPTSVGGSLFSIAVSFRGIDIQKALESSDTLIIEFPNDEEKNIWLKGLIHASYKASVPAALDILEKENSHLLKSHMPINHAGTANLVINGALLETKLSLYGKSERSLDGNCEILILELLASGGKVNLARSDADLIAKIKLHSLKIKDDLQGRITGSPQYLFCSLLKNEVSSTESVCLSLNEDVSFKTPLEDDDIYIDALPDFVSVPDQTFHVQNVNMVTNTNFNLDDLQHPIHGNSTYGMDYGKCLMSEVYYEIEAIDCSDFVNVTFTTRSPDSPLYDGVDTLMFIQMSKLDFFCHRPTLVALIELGLDLSSVNSEQKNGNKIHSYSPDSSHNESRNEETGRSVIKGLLGGGKRRVVFHLSMDVDSVCVFLNLEDGSQLAMFVQERFLLDFMVHPSSFSVEGSLGNMKLYNMLLGPNHRWGWLCDIRDQRAESLIKFNFKSYFKEDDDYEGHDYFLSGQLSAVRIIFLYRFVQEFIAYFMELATPHTEEVIKFVDKVGGLEWLIQKCEIDGATSFKLDLSLDTPVIIIPYNSMSKNFMQLDLGQLRVYNNFSWHGGECKNHSAVHLDILHAEIHGINMAIGIDGHLRRPMVGKIQGLEIIMRRSLRDIFRKVPKVSVEVKTGLVHCVMSDKEYSIILECAYNNISEEPKIPPSFRISNFDSKDSIRMLVDKVHFNGQALLSGTVAIVSVEIQFALLELCNGPDEESPMAQISMEGLWVSYRYTSLSESDLYVTIPKFSILDIRPDVKAEMRLMLGSSSDVLKLDSSNFNHSCKDYSLKSCNCDCPGIIKVTTNTDIANLTMLVIDIRWRSTSKSIVIRMQQPRVLVVLEFLLAVVEFFVPALRAITGREETSDHKNDPIVRNDNIIPVEPIHMQRTELVLLSPKRKLIIDVPGFDEVIYDGCGGTLRLTECETDNSSPSGLGPLLIIIGRGKSLRFRNVKIENGAFLRKCTYLSCDSSYSVNRNDDVTISLKDLTIYEDNDMKDGGSQGLLKDQNGQDLNSDLALNQMQSFSFEAQIVSPEFTFYDSAKVSIDDSSPIEKLLRAKMDISFMYAAKCNDIWVRSLVKDITVEAGSGLVLLDPMDISGAYTSVKDKTNISVISSDICIHLSLSVASLLLQLYQQAATALRFGNVNPLASCTNFKKIWASQKGIMPDYCLTFWRPQAPLNYAILGDCVTSRPIPPIQVVIAISNTYGRVKKPLGFKLIGLFSDFQKTEEKKHQPNVNDECSLWMPLAPPGYSAVGCVVHIGSEPPPNHIVYCIRSDLVTSTTFSDCIFTVPDNSRLSSEFSIWRIDNAACSFYAHGSLGCPTKSVCFELHQILLCNHDYDHSHTCMPNPDATVQHSQSDEMGSENSSNSSGWNVLRSYSNSNGCYISSPHFERIWWNRGFDHHRPISIWRSVPRPGFSILGDCIVEGLEPPSLGVLFKHDLSEISARPVQFTRVAHINRKGLDDAYFWYPIAPPGYASLGCVVTKTEKIPDKDLICCPRLDVVSQSNMSLTPISESCSKGSKWSIWKVENQACTFLARPDHKRPSGRLAFSISDHVKPKTRENISAEIKLGRFSLTILDGIYGMITPLFDVTIVNTNLATHGRPDSINAVLICSVAASTFNKELEAWEPLVESFDGIFKVETYDVNGRVGKHVHVAATSTINLNLSAGSLETLVESLVSWRSHNDFDQKSIKKFEESGVYLKSNVDSMPSALEEDDLNKVILENRLGCDLYLRKVNQSTETIELLSFNKHVVISISPPRFSDRLNVVNGSKEGRFYVAVQIFEAEDLPILDDGNGHDFFCALRMVIDSNTSDRHKLFPQSARTRSTKPFVSKNENLDKGTAKWNELFLFEIPEKGSATLELEITNLSSKAGKGEIIGALSIPIRNYVNTLKRASSIRMLMAMGNKEHISSYSLKRRNQLGSGNHDCGILLMSTSFYDQNTILNAQREVDNSNTTEGDIGFWVGGGSSGPWVSFGSLLTLSVIPKSLNGKHFAFEVFTRNGNKYAVLRPLAKVINDTDVKLEISVCPAAVLNKQDLNTLRNVFAVLNPGSSALLPWSSMSIDSELCLQVRPFCESLEVYYTWSQTFASNTASNEVIINQGFFPKQSSMKQGNISMTASNLMLKQLEKKDVLLQCKSDVSFEQHFWLCARTDASSLHPDINNPVHDWRINITSPLRLENKLPYQAEYSIWEQTIEGNHVKRQNGIILSEGSAFIYSINLSRPIYLTFFIQDGWILDQDAVLLMDISSLEFPSSFRMVHEQKKRKLHVSIERDLGGSIAAPKTIRFFVPYSINNDTGIPLSYRIVETEPFHSADAESLSLNKQAKSAKFVLRHTPSFADKKNPSFRGNILEEIEDSTLSSVMLSPLDYMNRSSRSEPYIYARVGISIAACHSDNYSPGISLYMLENKERVDIKAFASNDSYYKLSVTITMVSDRTKVIHFQPHTIFINKVGCRLCLKQCSNKHSEWISPAEPLRLFEWRSSAKNELLKLCLDGYKWSTDFTIETEGVMNVPLRNMINNKQMFVRIEVRSGFKNSRYEIIFRNATSTAPYRIENRSMFLSVYFRQVDGFNDSWQFLLPNSSVSFCWEDLGRQRLLEFLPDDIERSKSEKYNIDDVMDHKPNQLASGPMKNIFVSIVKEGKMKICRISDWIPEFEHFSSHILKCSSSSLDSELQIIFELADLGLSIIDRTPEEILYLSVQNPLLSYSTGLASGISRLNLRVRGIQVDNQLPFTPMPVLFRLQRIGAPGEYPEYILKFSVTMQRNNSLDLCIYPYLDIQGPEDSAFLVNIHEPVIWRLHEMIEQANLSRISVSQNKAVSIDPIIQIGYLNTSEVRFKVSMSMSPTQRPGGVLGFWLSLMTALGNLENMNIKINKRFRTDIYMRQSALINTAISNVQKDLLSQPLRLLSGVDILGNASSALGHMSKGVAALSMDRKFIQSRQKQESKGVEDISDVIREGGGALAKGFFRGVTGILTKPLEGAKSSGMEGFVQGVGKGIIGAAAQPVSGVLDLLSKTTEGANAVRMKIASSITSEDQLLRRRLPRVIGADNLIKPFFEHGANGQAILQLAESGTFFGQVDLFKVRGKFALSDAYEDHFMLPEGKIILITHRRVLLLLQPSNFASQKKFNPTRDPCSVAWDVLWDDLMTMALKHGMKDQQRSPPSCLFLYLNRTTEKENVFVVKCTRESQQALEIYNSIEKAVMTYGPNRSKEIIKKVTKPYSPICNTSALVFPKVNTGIKANHEVPDMVSSKF